jgi:hypothetical protein
MPLSAPFKFDEVGIWSELKLEIVEKYGAAYTRAFANQPRLKKYYVDAFSGAGVHISKRRVEAFRQRLTKAAGFRFVPDPLPMRNSNNAVVYYLFFASQKPVAEKIIHDIFAKYR